MLTKLTGKNREEYEHVAQLMMDNADERLFKELVDKDDFLFDFIKQNVSDRLSRATNQNNWKSLLKFLKYYSPYYEDFICSTLAKYSDEDLTDNMLELFENGSEDEKTYCAKYFSYIQDTLAIDLLKQNSYTNNENLNANCAMTLSKMQEKTCIDEAIEKLNSNDDFEQLSAVKFLVNYKDKQYLKCIINVMQNSSMSENIAGEIPYLEPLSNILKTDFESGLLILNNIINGLGEILPLSSIFDYELYDIFSSLIEKTSDSKVAVVLVNAQQKFEILTENDEYIFDEDKNTKNEVYEIKNLLSSLDIQSLRQSLDEELTSESPFVYTALDYSKNTGKIRNLLSSANETLVLKSAETLKQLNSFDETSKQMALKNVTNSDIKSILVTY